MTDLTNTKDNNHMLTLYVYDQADRVVVARIHGANNGECEAFALRQYGDAYGWTYSPAFGAVDGLVDSSDAEDHSSDAVA